MSNLEKFLSLVQEHFVKTEWIPQGDSEERELLSALSFPVSEAEAERAGDSLQKGTQSKGLSKEASHEQPSWKKSHSQDSWSQKNFEIEYSTSYIST